MVFAFNSTSNILTKNGIELYDTGTPPARLFESQILDRIAGYVMRFVSPWFAFMTYGIIGALIPNATAATIISFLGAAIGIGIQYYKKSYLFGVNRPMAFTGWKDYLEVYGILLALTLTSGFAINPMLAFLQEAMTADANVISIISSLLWIIADKFI